MRSYQRLRRCKMQAELMNIVKDVAIILGAGVVRSVAGWLPKAMADNKIVKFEVKQLVQTTIRIGTIGLFGYFGFAIAGVENTAVAAAVGAFFADKIFNAMKQKK